MWRRSSHARGTDTYRACSQASMALRPAAPTAAAAVTTYSFPGVLSQHVPGVNGEKGSWVQARTPLGTLAAFTLWVGTSTRPLVLAQPEKLLQDALRGGGRLRSAPPHAASDCRRTPLPPRRRCLPPRRLVDTVKTAAQSG